MSQQSKIEWTNATWNPVAGCEKISSGCAFCYACKDAIRMGSNPNPKVSSVYEGLAYRQDNGLLNWTGKVRTIESRLSIPYAWGKNLRVFVNSQSDLFHKDVPDEFIEKVFAVMRQCSWLTFQVLTKRSERMAELSKSLLPAPNVWMGVSVENQDAAYRIEHLKAVPARIRFLSVEPMIGPVEADFTGLQWVITGGESGPRARHFDPAWAISVRDQCKRDGVLFFHKQNGGRNKKASGRLLGGKTYDEIPDDMLSVVPTSKQRRLLMGGKTELPLCS